MKKTVNLTRREFLELSAAFCDGRRRACTSPQTPMPAPPARGCSSPIPSHPPEAATGRAANRCPCRKGSCAGRAQGSVPHPREPVRDRGSRRRILPAEERVRRASGTGLQQMALDALWYIDPDAGVDGVWDNALAAEKPIYNTDFTEMTVKLRKGIYWSDGVEFTADDLIYTVDIQRRPRHGLHRPVLRQYATSMEQPDNYTVVFKLTKSNSRFHGLHRALVRVLHDAQARVREGGDPVAFKFNPPVSLGAYTLKDFDPNGNWYLWQRREDWQRTSVARFGMPVPSTQCTLRLARATRRSLPRPPKTWTSSTTSPRRA